MSRNLQLQNWNIRLSFSRFDFYVAFLLISVYEASTIFMSENLMAFQRYIDS